MMNNRYSQYRLNSDQQGVGLVEVMVSLVMLAIGVLGFTALQYHSHTASSESTVRTVAMNAMRDLGDSMRANPADIDTYMDKLNGFHDEFVASGSATEPTKTCGIYGDSVVCTPEEQAVAESYKASTVAYNNGFKLRMDICPGSGNGDTSSSMKTYCLLAAWNTTEAQFGSDGSLNGGVIDCMSDTTGTYYRRSECLVMEAM